MIKHFVDGNIGYIVLERPEKRNALCQAMWRALPDAVSELDRNTGVRVIVLQGAGENFTAGADIAEFDTVYATRDTAAAYAAGIAGAMATLTGGQKPRIAVIAGACFGGGVALALSCDLRFAAESASFAITPAKLGLAYSFEDTRRLVASIGAAAARDLLFSARTIDATEALRIRLINRVFGHDELHEQAAAYCAAVAALAPGSIRVARDFIARALGGQQGEDAATANAYLDVLESPDFGEGRRAFREKRKPKF
jgi:enoyl-CoA hydratase/carnithine racemase